MKKLFLSLVLLATTQFIQAQTNNNLPEKVKNQVEVLKNSDLKLSDAQLSRITSVLVAENDKVVKSQMMLEGNPSALHTRMVELKKVMITNIQGGMTPLQVEKFDLEHLGDKL